MTEFYNNHYIRIRDDGCITDGWSDGPHGGRTPTADEICMQDKGGYQFRLLFADGTLSEENPALYDGMYMIPLYRWDGSAAVMRSPEEIEAERAALPVPEAAPTQLDRVEAQATYTAMMTDTLLEG